MLNQKRSIIKQRVKYAISDFIMTSLALFVFNIVRYELLLAHTFGSLWSYLGSRVLVLEQIFVPIGLMGVYFLSGYYNRPFRKSRLQELLVTTVTAAVNTVIIFLIFLINDPAPKRRTEYLVIFLLFAILLIFTYIGRVAITISSLRYERYHASPVRTVIIGNSHASRKMKKRLDKDRSNINYEVVGFVPVEGEHDVIDDGPVVNFSDINDFCRGNDVEQIIIALEHYDDTTVLRILDRLFPIGVPVKITPGILSYVTAGIRIDDIMAQPLIDLTSPRIGDFSVNVKRAFDVTLSFLALVILSPLLLGVAIAVKMTSKGPVFYRQERMGRRQKPFTIYKFRSMYVNAEKSGPRLSNDNDPRVTDFGRFMRKYRIDETPQFWNVIKGDMSIVGPRPEREFYIRQILSQAPYYCLVYQVRPGITSWGMVKYGYASTIKEMVGRTKYDLMYITNMSIPLDLKIMLFTIKTILSGRGK